MNAEVNMVEFCRRELAYLT